MSDMGGREAMDRQRLLTSIVAIFISLTAVVSSSWAHQLQDKAAVQQKLDSALPLDVELKDESGRTVSVGRYFGQRPVLLSFVYLGCPMLCPLTLKSLARGLSAWGGIPGREYELVIVSIDPADTASSAADNKKSFMRLLITPRVDWQSGEGVHFLTGSEKAIKRLADAAGVTYTKDEESHEYAHPVALIAVTPEGRISRYLLGLEFPARDIQLAVVEARQGKIGSLTDSVVLFCFHYDPRTGRYSLAVLNLLKVAAVLTVLVLGGLIYLLQREEKRS